jgi:hypothetical protein
MKKCLWMAGFVVAVNLFPLRATTVIMPTPTVGVAVGGVMVDSSSLVITRDPATGLIRLSGPLNSPGAWTLSIDVTAEPDSSVVYAVTGSNQTNSPLTFSFTLGTPLLLGPYEQVTSQSKGSARDSNGSEVTVSSVTQRSLPSGSSFSGAEFGSGIGTATSAAASASYTALATNVGFTISALDSASFSGSVVGEAPEPASMALTFLGLLLVPIALRLRRKA